MSNVRLYLDFDGVFNADKPCFGDVTTLAYKMRRAPGFFEVYTVTYSPTMVAAINSLVNRHDAEVVWVSTWNENLHVLRVTDSMGFLPGARVINVALDHNAPDDRAWTKWKADGLVSDQKGDPSPFIWVDDEAVSFHGENVLAEVGDTPNLMLVPNGYQGLTASHLSEMENFVSRHS